MSKSETLQGESEGLISAKFLVLAAVAGVCAVKLTEQVLESDWVNDFLSDPRVR